MPWGSAQNHLTRVVDNYILKIVCKDDDEDST